MQQTCINVVCSAKHASQPSWPSVGHMEACDNKNDVPGLGDGASYPVLIDSVNQRALGLTMCT
jgi:hypothetical protein